MKKATWRRMAIGLFGVFAAVAVLVVTVSSPAGAGRPLARAVLYDVAGDEIGNVTFKGRGHHAESIRIDLALPVGAPGVGEYHGLHVHTTGACVAPFTSAGGHWNLTLGANHGGHTGDLPSVLVAPDGTAHAVFQTHRFDVNQLFDSDGSAVVLHVGPDNFGNVPRGGGKYEDPNNWYDSVDPAGTARTGDAGARYGCGVVTARKK